MRSLYEHTSPAAPETSALTGDHEADFVVIGAGYTGLSAAIHTASRGVSTIVLEAHGPGFGGSGRNHGHCVPVLGFINPEDAARRLGAERGARFTSIAVHSGRRVFELAARYDIDCEAAPTGALQLAHRPEAAEHLKRQCDFYARLGVEARLVSRDESVAMMGSEAFHGGWLHPEGGHLNPLAFARGLARAAMQEGARIHTNSPARSVEKIPGGWRIVCPQGTVTAKRVGIATNAYTGGLLAPLGQSYFTMEAYGLASEPLDPAVRAKLIPGNQSVGDTRPDVRYMRFDRDNRLIVGGLVETLRGRFMAWTGDSMRRKFTRVFPELAGLKWDWHWSGKLAINMDRRPHLYNPAEGLFALVGYSGRGVPTATALGEILGEAGCGIPANELPMEVSPLKALWPAPVLSFTVPRVRGPFTRMQSLWK